VIQEYTAGQAADMRGSIDAFQQMSQSKEQGSLADRLHKRAVPVRLLVGTLPHPAEMTRDQRERLGTELPDSRSDSVPGSGQYIQEEQPAPVVAAVARLDAAAC
jgi:pimeloyl-ACP methyl ester carboxylesterase